MSPLPEINLSNLAYMVSHWIVTQRRDPNMFDLNAPYQRGSVWTDDQRRNLIKSLIMGLPIGQVIVSKLPYKEGCASYRIVDGKQRVETVQAFFDDRFTIPTEWLQPRYLGIPYTTKACLASDLSDTGRRHIENANMGALEFDPSFVYVENPDYDPTLNADDYKNRGNPKCRRWITEPRNDDQILQAEAELYLLVNFGGVPQTDTDKARASGIAKGEQ